MFGDGALKRHIFLFLLIIISALEFPKHSFALDGDTQATAFTHIGMARNVSPKDRHAWFNLSGNIFKSYIKSDGSVIILRDYGDGAGTLPTNSSWDNTQGRFILPAAALAAMNGMTKVGYAHGPVSLLDVTTDNATIIARVKANLPLHKGAVDNTINNDWTGLGAIWLTPNASCNNSAPTKTLPNVVIHICGSPAGTILWPGSGFQRVKWALQEIPDTDYLEVSVLADPVTIPPNVVASLNVTKTASHDTDVAVGQVVTYTYEVENTGDVVLTNVTLADVHNGFGAAPVPNIETATITDIGVNGDSSNPNGANNAWDSLAPKDKLTLTATYTVTQADIDNHQ